MKWCSNIHPYSCMAVVFKRVSKLKNEWWSGLPVWTLIWILVWVLISYRPSGGLTSAATVHDSLQAGKLVGHWSKVMIGNPLLTEHHDFGDFLLLAVDNYGCIFVDSCSQDVCGLFQVIELVRAAVEHLMAIWNPKDNLYKWNMRKIYIKMTHNLEIFSKYWQEEIIPSPWVRLGSPRHTWLPLLTPPQLIGCSTESSWWASHRRVSRCIDWCNWDST